MEQNDLYRIARRRVAADELRKLDWFPFPLGGWAIGLTIHGLAVMLSTSGLRERAIADELRKLEATPGAR